MPGAVENVPTIALLIPAYNAADFLPGLLEAARRQTHAFDEIIVVDDASTDHTRSVLERDGVRWFGYAENVGSAVARNKLLEMARSDYVHFHDADDGFLADTFVEKLLPRAGETTAAFCDWKSHGPEGEEHAHRYDDLPATPDWARWWVNRHVHLNATIYPRRFLAEQGGFDGRLRTQQDLMLNIQMAAAGLDFAHVPETLAGHWRREDSTLGRMDRLAKCRASQRLCEVALEKLDPRLHPELGDKLYHHLREAVGLGGYREAASGAALLARYGLRPRHGGWLERALLATLGPSTALRYLAWRGTGRETAADK